MLTLNPSCRVSSFGTGKCRFLTVSAQHHKHLCNIWAGLKRSLSFSFFNFELCIHTYNLHHCSKVWCCYILCTWKFLPHLHLFDQKYSINRNFVIFQFKITVSVGIDFKLQYSCDAKLNVQHHYSSLQGYMKSFYYANLMLKNHLYILCILNAS